MTSEASEGAKVLFRVVGLDVTGAVTSMWIVMAVIAILSWMATRRIKKVPTGVQNLLEFLMEMLMGFYAGLMGREKAKKYLPFLVTMFLFILLSNYSGLIPGFGHLPGLQAPTSVFSVTAGLAITVFLATHVIGVMENGLGYFKRFGQPMIFFLPLNIIEEFVKPLSLSLRLYGNIYGEEMTIAVLLSLLPFAAPVPMMMLSVLMGFIQALVFTLLASVYVGNAAGHGH